MSQDTYIDLIDLPTGSQTLYFGTQGTDYVFNAQRYLAGFISELPNIIQSSKVLENQTRFTFSDIDNSIYALFASSQWRGKKLIVRRVFLDQQMRPEATQIIHSESLYEVKRNASPQTKLVEVTCKDFSATDVVFGRKTNSQSQQQIDPTDDCFEFTPFIQPNQPWGREGMPTNFDGPTNTGPRYDPEEQPDQDGNEPVILP